MASSPRFPSAPTDYTREWGSQYTRQLEQALQDIWVAIQALQKFRAPSYSTADRLLISALPGQIVYDTDIEKLFVMTGSGWEQITSV